MAMKKFDLDIDDNTNIKIEQLQIKLGLSQSEVIAYAIALLIELFEERKKGKNIFIPSRSKFYKTEKTTTINLPY
jgi:hypothetical protein